MEKVHLYKYPFWCGEGDMCELVQPGGKWGLPWGLFCETSGRRELYMVLYHSFHIYGIWTSRSKTCGGRFKFIKWGQQCNSKRGWLFIGKEVSHYVTLLYCETLLSLLMGTVKDFRTYLFSLYYCCFTCFVSNDIGKTKNAIKLI